MKSLAKELENYIKVMSELLLDDINSMRINIIENKSNLLIEVWIKNNEAGKLIGKHGKMAKSIRNIVEAVGAKNKKIIDLHILTDEEY